MEVIHQVFDASCVDVPGHISNDSEWKQFRNRLVDAELLDEDGAVILDKIWQRCRMFGADQSVLSYKSFSDGVLELQTARGGSMNKQVTHYMSQVVSRADNMKQMCDEWPPDENQTKQLLSIIGVLREQHNLADEQLKNIEQYYRQIFVSRRHTGLENETTAFHYHQENRTHIEKLCSSYRVRGNLLPVDPRGAKRKSPMTINNRLQHAGSGNSLEIKLGQASNGSFVEIISLRSPSAKDADITSACNCHAAHRELIESVYFPRWMGSSKSAELYYEYSRDFISVKDLISKHGILSEDQPLLQAILSKTLDGLSDILYQSTFEIKSRITLSQLFICQRGNKLLFGNLEWGDNQWIRECTSRKDISKWHENRERALLRDFGKIVESLVAAFRNTKSSLIQDEPDTIAYSYMDAIGGLRLIEGTRFRLFIPSSKPGKVWKCFNIINIGVTDEFHQIIGLECPEDLEFLAVNPGTCKLVVREMEWWEEGEETTESLKNNQAPETNKELVFQISVYSKDASSTALIVSVLASCENQDSEIAPIRLRDLAERYRWFQLDVHSEQEIEEDYIRFVSEF